MYLSYPFAISKAKTLLIKKYIKVKDIYLILFFNEIVYLLFKTILEIKENQCKMFLAVVSHFQK